MATVLTADPTKPLQSQLDNAPDSGDLIVNLGDGNIYSSVVGSRDLLPIWFGRVCPDPASAPAVFQTRAGRTFLRGLSTISLYYPGQVFWSGDTPLAGTERMTNPLDGSRIAYRLAANTQYLANYGGYPALRKVPGQTYSDGWSGIGILTIEFAVQFLTTVNNSAQIIGMHIGGLTTPSPWVISTQSGGGFSLGLMLASGTLATAQLHNTNLVSSTAAPMRVTFQLDLTAGTCYGWIQDQPVQMTLTNFSPNMVLGSNRNTPFLIEPTQFGHIFCGLRITDGIALYTGNSPIVGVSNSRYWDYTNTNYIIWLSMRATNDQRISTYNGVDTTISDRFVTATSYSTSTPFYLLKKGFHNSPSGQCSQQFIQDVTFQGRVGSATLVWMWCQSSPVLNNLNAQGGTIGLHVSGEGEVYVLNLIGGVYNGSDACVDLNTTIVCASGVNLGVGGRVFIRANQSGGTWTGGLWGNPPSFCYAYVDLSYSASIASMVFTACGADDESGSRSSFIAPYIITTGNNCVVSFTLMAMGVTDHGGGRPIVQVTGAANPPNFCTVNLIGVTSAASVRVAGSGVDSGRWNVLDNAAGTTIDALPAATTIDKASDLIPIWQNGTVRKATPSQVQTTG